ncbi:MAG TPA: ABC transporter ATP-binding protein [Vicinamibacteria bacterium]|nr:ABC transporter ATP-binding protein [Vicinamibacteria bacterium]
MSASDGFFRTPGVPIRVSGLQKVYRTAAEEVQALRSLAWSVDPGQAVAVIGPSGCGKTTLLNLLGGVDRPTAGTVSVDGEDLTKAGERALERYRLLKVGFVFQFFNLIPTLTATENLELPMMVAGRPPAERTERARRLLEMVGLGAKGHKRPEELSGGEQQRVAVAVALANDPALILADEPTGNLDSRTTEVIATLLVSLATEHGKTVIMSSHDPKAVGYFPSVHPMRDGAFERPQEDA